MWSLGPAARECRAAAGQGRGRAAPRRYAWECQTAEGGWGLDGVLREGAWKLRGIVNGIDTHEWSPASDAHLRSDGYANYSATDLREGKARCKAALQRVRARARPPPPPAPGARVPAAPAQCAAPVHKERRRALGRADRARQCLAPVSLSERRSAVS
jgi:hypothetical protein